MPGAKKVRPFTAKDPSEYLYEDYRDKGYSNDAILVHMHPGNNPAHAKCQICADEADHKLFLEEMSKPFDLGAALTERGASADLWDNKNNRSDILADHPDAEYDALRNKGFTEEQIRSDSAADLPITNVTNTFLQ